MADRRFSCRLFRGRQGIEQVTAVEAPTIEAPLPDAPASLDVTDEQRHEFAFVLLRNLEHWRARSTEQIQLSTALWAERVRTIEAKALTDVPQLSDTCKQLFGDDPDSYPESLKLILPLAGFPKDPLFDLELRVADSPVTRTSRKRNGDLQAEYVEHLARAAGVGQQLERSLIDFLAAIFTFRPSAYEGVKIWLRWRPLKGYLKKSIAMSFDQKRYKEWKVESDRICKIASEYTLWYRASATHNPLLALPAFLRDCELQFDDEQVLAFLRDLHGLLSEAKKRISADGATGDQKEAARLLLSTYSVYGRRFEAMTECTVPLRQPFIIRVSEKRPLHFDYPNRGSRLPCAWVRDLFLPRTYHYVSFGDADSNHVQISVPDSSVQVVRWRSRARSDTWGRLPKRPNRQGSPGDERKTVEYYSRYDSTDRRGQRIWVECSLRQSFLRLIMTWGVTLATFSAWWLMMRFGYWDYNPDARLNGADVVALLVPVTFAASLLLLRESSTLGMRVKRIKQILLMVALAGLWGTTVYFYITGRIVIDTLHQDP
ncbi:hypothetical protein [Streptomyces sp. NPDC055299]